MPLDGEPLKARDRAAADTADRSTTTAAALEPAVEGRWSARRTLLFVLVVCGGFWAAVALGVGALLS